MIRQKDDKEKEYLRPGWLKTVLIFLLGAICFVLGQPLFRIPLLNRITELASFQLAILTRPVLTIALVALSAGVVEEGMRFLFRAYLLNRGSVQFKHPVYFGLGHGLAEAVYLLLPLALTLPLALMGWALVERALAVIFHIGLSVVVWNGIQRQKPLVYLALAIILHTFIDFVAIWLPLQTNLIWPVELILFLADAALLIMLVQSRKLYRKEVS